MEEIKKKYIPLKDLEVYQLSRELSKIGWNIYVALDWQTKKILGDQFIESTDSTGSNIAEGYSRFHYLDKIKFYYNSRASLSECNDHWLELMRERNKVADENYKKFKIAVEKLSIKLQNFITATYNQKINQKQ
jgi:four helix bundle protein